MDRQAHAGSIRESPVLEGVSLWRRVVNSCRTEHNLDAAVAACSRPQGKDNRIPLGLHMLVASGKKWAGHAVTVWEQAPWSFAVEASEAHQQKEDWVEADLARCRRTVAGVELLVLIGEP